MTARSPLDEIDRRLVQATQGGLPLVARPYAAIADQLGIDPGEVSERLARMLESGIIRRVGLVPNHYALGLTHNAMTVWDVDDDAIEALGARIGALEFVTHCYERPRRPPVWPYNLFAMVHGAGQAEVDGKIAAIVEILGPACRARDVLISTRILKKAGLRIAS